MRVRKKDSSLDALVVGGGSFGTALGLLLANNQRRVEMWVRRPDQAEEINRTHCNSHYFPDLKLPKSLRATTDLADGVARSEVVIMAIPSRTFREAARAVGDHLRGDQILVHVTKGFEPKTYQRMSEVLREETCALKIGALSGPNLSKELVAGFPSGALVASHYREVSEKLQILFEGSPLRLYGGRDVIGAEVGGAFKNIIALMSGAAAGMGFGDNTKSLIMTRGLAEMARYGVALGADVFTFGGLAGIGDLIATCSSPLSRNHQVGRRMVQGETLQTILETTTQVAEGVPTTQVVYQQGKQLKLDLPMVQAVYETIYEGADPKQVLQRLMNRPLGKEMVRLPRGVPS